MDNIRETFELDELYWFIERKEKGKTKENIYIMTMVERDPRRIIGNVVAKDKSAWRIQEIVDKSPEAKTYCTDGYYGYLSVIFPGNHIYNTHNKSDTYTAEGVNADLRHYIPCLKRRSRCFARTIETLQAVIDVFVTAYNKFGIAKFNYRQLHPKPVQIPFSLLDFL